jgi:hypothetical protein
VAPGSPARAAQDDEVVTTFPGLGEDALRCHGRGPERRPASDLQGPQGGEAGVQVGFDPGIRRVSAEEDVQQGHFRVETPGQPAPHPHVRFARLAHGGADQDAPESAGLALEGEERSRQGLQEPFQDLRRAVLRDLEDQEVIEGLGLLGGDLLDGIAPPHHRLDLGAGGALGERGAKGFHRVRLVRHGEDGGLGAEGVEKAADEPERRRAPLVRQVTDQEPRLGRGQDVPAAQAHPDVRSGHLLPGREDRVHQQPFLAVEGR